MDPNYLRTLIDDHGRSTLLQAANLFQIGLTLEAICQDLLLDIEQVQDVIFAGFQLRYMAEDQAEFEKTIVEPF